MNSNKLINLYPEIYRNLFSKCSIVCSAPRIFPFTTESAHLFGTISICQKIPLRTYVGLEKINKKEIIFSDYYEYDPRNDKFNKKLFDKLTTERIKRYIIPLLANKKNGYKVQMIMELPWNRGLSGNSTFNLGLNACIFTELNKLDNEILNGWKNNLSKKLLKENIFNELILSAWKSHAITNANTGSSGAGIFHSIISSDYPTLFYYKKDKQIEDFKGAIISDFNKINKNHYWGRRINEIYDINNSIWPINYVLFYSGKSESFYDSMLFTEEPKKLQSKHIINDKLKNDFSINQPRGLVLQEEDLRNKYFDAIGALSIEAMFALGQIYEKGVQSNFLKHFIYTINKSHNAAHLFNLSNSKIDYLVAILLYEASKANINLGIKSTTRKKSDLLAVFYQDEFKNILIDSINNLKNNIDKNICLDYISWEDGYETEGLKIEQYIEKGIYSKFISKGAITIREYVEDNLTTKIISREAFEKEKKETDLLLDLKNKDIYVKGNKLTSHDIHSASTTIEILKILLKFKGENVTNKELPESSYTFERGELQSKIVTPLVKAVKKYADRELDLKITGSLTSFEVCLNINDLKISVLEKIL